MKKALYRLLYSIDVKISVSLNFCRDANKFKSPIYKSVSNCILFIIPR